MTAEERQSMRKFEAKVRSVIAKFRVLQKENADLYAELEEKENEIARLEEELKQRTSDYKNLKLAKMIDISDSDVKESRQKITKLVREINKCISILSTGVDSDEEL